MGIAGASSRSFFLFISLFFVISCSAEARRSTAKEADAPRTEREKESARRRQSQVGNDRYRSELQSEFAGIGVSIGKQGTESHVFDGQLVSGVISNRIRSNHVSAIKVVREPMIVRNSLAAYLYARSLHGKEERVGHHVDHGKCAHEGESANCVKHAMSYELECMFKVWPVYSFEEGEADKWVSFIVEEKVALEARPDGKVKKPPVDELNSSERKLIPTTSVFGLPKPEVPFSVVAATSYSPRPPKIGFQECTAYLKAMPLVKIATPRI